MSINRNDFIYLSYLLLAFLIPIGNIVVTYSIGIMVFAWLLNNSWKEKLNNLRENKLSVLFILFYCLFLVGWLYSENKTEANFKIVQKVALLIVPLIIFSVPVLKQKLFMQIMNAFLYGCILMLMYNELMAFVNYYHTGEIRFFFYEDFSTRMHPSYLSLCFVIAIAYTVYLIVIPPSNNLLADLFYGLMAFILLCGIVQLSSKAGIISLTFIPIVLAFHLVRIKRKPSLNKILFVGTMGAFTFLMLMIVNKHERFSSLEKIVASNEVNKSAVESNQVRVLVWKSAIELIKQKPIAGYGTGDANDVLLVQYQLKGYTGAAGKKLNAHNQYLQVVLTIGFIGLFMMIYIFCSMFYFAVHQKNYLGLIFIGLIAFNFLVESMLETRNGLAIFSFFGAILFCKMLEPYDKKTSPN